MVADADDGTKENGNGNEGETALATAKRNLGGTVVAPTTSETRVELWNGARVTDDDLRSITSFGDVLDLFGGEYVDAAQEFGTGFAICDNKDTLIGQTFAIIDARLNPNGNFGEFVSMLVVTEDNRKMVVNDGSTGIREQLIGIMAKTNRDSGTQRRPIVVRKGLRRSDYEVELPDPRDPAKTVLTKASTYYLDLSA